MKIGDKAFGGIYAGKINGHYIVCSPIEYELPFQVNWLQATEYCKSVAMDLPTKEELKLLYNLYKSFPEYIPKRQYLWYWSSTESSPRYAWLQSLYDSAQGTYSKTGISYVRPIKRIKI